MLWWTREEMEAVLLQLEEGGWLFGQYRFVRKDGGLSLLGKGSYAYVFEALKTGKRQELPVALEVIGFGNKRMDPPAFEQCMKLQKKC